MDTDFKLRERAERYRQIARNTFNPKIAHEIEKIAEDYEHSALAEQGPPGAPSGRW